ncbi:hypothetical protein BDN72DRAFT_836575 [Pluteus cervinus]|uniref:Uncharacterized protein n=1 Tax=Pluteus cervinus TaxID=181527 RepID=A0ACD3B2P8_9AGAR|nr:hypothetical protein BDN72DRAFT_836575 [Pluteus cervinus]
MPSSVLEGFDPFATHPFTNGNGVLPPPPQPSQYSFPIPSTQKFPQADTSGNPPLSSSYSSQSSSSGSVASMNSNASSPSHSSTSSSPLIHTSSPPPRAQPPIFVPFRQDSSSPDLVLKKAKGSPVKTSSRSRP